MSTRETRRQNAEDQALNGLQVFLDWHVQSPLGKKRDCWVSARDVAAVTGEPVRSTARALLRLVASGQVSVITQLFRDCRHRPRERRLYQLCSSLNVDVWPAWAMLSTVVLPQVEEIKDEKSV